MTQHTTQSGAPPSGSWDPGAGGPARRRRADARRNVDALIEAARTVFATSGVDAPAKEITDLAGVGVGTLYRHFPNRIDVVEALYENDVHILAEAAQRAVAELEGMGHPDAEPKLIGRNIHVMLTPLPINKRKPKFHMEAPAEADGEEPEAPESPAAPPPPSGGS